MHCPPIWRYFSQLVLCLIQGNSLSSIFNTYHYKNSVYSLLVSPRIFRPQTTPLVGFLRFANHFWYFCVPPASVSRDIRRANCATYRYLGSAAAMPTCSLSHYTLYSPFGSTYSTRAGVLDVFVVLQSPHIVCPRYTLKF